MDYATDDILNQQLTMTIHKKLFQFFALLLRKESISGFELIAGFIDAYLVM